jgi:hypothetical protein
MFLALLLALSFWSSGAAVAQTNGIDVTASGGIGTTGPWVQGYSFVVDQPISATKLGVYDFNSDGLVSAHDVGLWDSGGTLLAATTVSSGTASVLDAGFRFEPIPFVPLGVGQSYYVGSLHLAGDGDEWIYNVSSLVAAPEITYESRRFVGSTTLAFPSRVGCQPCTDGYFGGNFQFTVVPEPNTALLVAMGLVGIGVRRRRLS